MVDYAITIDLPKTFFLVGQQITLRPTFDEINTFGLQFSDTLSYQARYLFTDTVEINLISSPITTFTWTENQVFLISSEANWVSALIEALSEIIGIDENLDVKLKIIISELIRLSDALETGSIYHEQISINLYLFDIFGNGVTGELSDSINLTSIFNILLGVYVAEQIGLSLSQDAPTTYNLALLQIIRFNESLQTYFGFTLSEILNTVDVASSQFITYPLVSDNLALSEVLSQILVFRVIFAETINLDDQDIIQQILTGSLEDGIEILAGYVAPSGSFTTWVVNTRSGATTEYQNYNFNSFTKLGNKYIGASSTGLYELLGDDDNSSTIVSTISSGLMQVAGSKFTSFKAAYLGIRGEGDYLLKLVSGEGQEYIYKVHVNTLKSARINLGKGLRSRYFSYQLQNIDTDFDLDTIEFIPIGANRRV